MPNTDTIPPIDTRTVLIVGRPEGGAVDPETGLAGPGGVCWREGLNEIRANAGETVTMPATAAAGFIQWGLAIDPADLPPEPVADATAPVAAVPATDAPVADAKASA